MASIASMIFTVEAGDSSEQLSRASRRIMLHTSVLKSTRICSGDPLAIASRNDDNSQKIYAVGIAWPSLDISQGSVRISTSLQLTARLEAGDSARIFLLSGATSPKPPGLPSLRKLQDAGVIRLKEVTDTQLNPTGQTPENKRDWLTLLLRETLVDLKYITCSQVVEVQYEGHKRRFSVTSITDQHTLDQDLEDNSYERLTHELNSLSIPTQSKVWVANWSSTVVLSQTSFRQSASSLKQDIGILTHGTASDAYSTVGGLNKQIQQVRDLLEIPLMRPELFRYFGLKPPRGILLHGPPGTGKTHLARAIAASTSSSVLVINGPELSSAYHGETESKLRDVFREARDKSPCIVVLDEVDALVPRREDGAGSEVEKRVVATLLTILDGIGEAEREEKVVVIGTTNRPNAIDPALRRPGRFDREIEIGIPDAEARFHILNVLLANTPHSISLEDLRQFSSRAHGYVGADLSALVREAGTIAIKRWLTNSEDPKTESEISQLRLSIDDLTASMPAVRPSAMRSLFVETPPMRYSDIGGQALVIQKLREAVEWPLLHPEAFQRLGVRPPKGVLLYGPPGCSKTVLARACACESGVNFVAVKGPELLNKFVGESERAVREIFRKARAASPSIIFFDEIDALATSRSSDNETSFSHEGVLTSLLNEMDGVQELVGVTVMAATNRPDAIDPALMRPGRLDRILYIGPPDHGARVEIFKIRTKNMAVEPDIDFDRLACLSEGCSGAEIVALCQEAAILTMKRNIKAPFVTQEDFLASAQNMKRQITPAVLQKFHEWSEKTQGRKV